MIESQLQSLMAFTRRTFFALRVAVYAQSRCVQLGKGWVVRFLVRFFHFSYGPVLPEVCDGFGTFLGAFRTIFRGAE